MTDSDFIETFITYYIFLATCSLIIIFNNYS